MVETTSTGFNSVSRALYNRYLERAFNTQIPTAPNCGGALKIIAGILHMLTTGIEDPPAIVKILSHLGLPTRAPPRSPAQRFDLFQTA